MPTLPAAAKLRGGSRPWDATGQELGYYPFGSIEFSNLVHYLRTGDFVRELLVQSSDASEFAFALGALAHEDERSDLIGPEQVNDLLVGQDGVR